MSVSFEFKVPQCRREFGAFMRYHRQRSGLSQETVTRALGLSARSNLSDYERGFRLPPGDIVRQLETIFHLRKRELERALGNVRQVEAAWQLVADIRLHQLDVKDAGDHSNFHCEAD